MRLQKKNMTGVFVFITILLAMGGIFLPGRILAWQSDAELNVVSEVPKQYSLEVSTAMARNASANLKMNERLQLIAGKWTSNVSVADTYEMETQDYEAIALAREGVQELYKNDLYPESVSSEYGSWYTWEATPYKAVDATFHTYTAYFWKVNFRKYNGLENHQVYMLEDGTIFYATVHYGSRTNMDSLIRLRDYFAQKGQNAVVISYNQKLISSYVPYTDDFSSDLQWMDLVKVTKEEYPYYVVQAYTEKSYLYSVAP